MEVLPDISISQEAQYREATRVIHKLAFMKDKAR